MVTGSPDYTERTEIQGLHDTTLTTIAVDSAGQLYALLKGEHDGVYVPLQLDDSGNIVAVMKGSDGTTLRTIRVDTSGRAIMVLRDPTSNNYVAVNASGFITAVLKGWDGTDLQSIKVDTAGRGIMVLRDPTSDNYAAINTNGQLQAVMLGQHNTTPTVMAVDADGNMIAKITDPVNIFGVTPYIGNAELAVRLGSINRWTRTGAVVMMDSFEYGQAYWDVTAIEADAEAVLTSSYFRSKGYCLKMSSGTPNGSASEVAIEQFTRQGSYSGFIALELHGANFPTAGYLEIQLHIFDGVDERYFDLKWDFEGGLIYYKNSGGTWTFTDVAIGYSTDPLDWHAIKIVGDTANTKYVRFLLDDTEIDLSDIACWSDNALAKPAIQINISFVAEIGDAAFTCYLDDIILTIAEV